MTKWEYKVVDLIVHEEVLLHNCGEDGWELVSVTETFDPYVDKSLLINPQKRTAYFKRPKQ